MEFHRRARLSTAAGPHPGQAALIALVTFWGSCRLRTRRGCTRRHRSRKCPGPAAAPWRPRRQPAAPVLWSPAKIPARASVYLLEHNLSV